MMKKISLCILAVMVLWSGFSADVFAQSSRLYLAGYMGLNTTTDMDFSDDATATNGSIKAKNAISFAGALGMRLSKNVRVEAELSYRSFDADTIDYNSAALGSLALEGKLKNWNGLLNAYYDFDVPWKFQPYVTGGVGFGWFEGDLSESTSGLSFEEDTTGLIWQAGAGLKYRTRSDVAITAGYRYLDGTDLDFDGFDLEYGSHEFRVGLEYDLH